MSKNLLLILSLFLLIGQSNEAAAKTKIQNLTSKEKGKDTEKVLQQSRIPSGLNVHSIGLGIGQTFLRGDLDDFANDQITWDLFYNYSASHSFDFVMNFHASTHEVKQTKTSILGTSLGIKAKVLHFDAFAPFVLGGLGFYNPQITRFVNGVLLESNSKIVFGYHLGVGADLRLNNKFSVGLLGHYHNPFDSSQDDGTADVEGSYFKLMVTGFYHF